MALNKINSSETTAPASSAESLKSATLPEQTELERQAHTAIIDAINTDSDELIIEYSKTQEPNEKNKPMSYKLSQRFRLPPDTKSDGPDYFLERKAVLKQIDYEGNTDIDLRSFALVAEATYGVSCIIAATPETGPAIMIDDKFIPLKPGFYKLGVVDNRISFERSSDPSEYSALYLHSRNKSEIPAGGLLFIGQGGDGRAFCRFSTIDYYGDRDIKDIAPELTVAVTQESSRLKPAVDPEDINPLEDLYNVPRHQQGKILAHQRLTQELLQPKNGAKEIGPYTTPSEYESGVETSDAITAIVKNLEGLDKSKVTVEVDKDETGKIKSLILSGLTQTQAYKLLGLYSGKRNNVGIAGDPLSAAVNETGLNFKDVAYKGEFWRSSVRYDNDGSGEYPDRVPLAVEKSVLKRNLGHTTKTNGRMESNCGFKGRVEVVGEPEGSIFKITISPDGNTTIEQAEIFFSCVNRASR